jgi:hypothetical protein
MLAQGVMQRGQIVVANNHLIAHMREKFENGNDLPRHKVRCWVQIQKEALVDTTDSQSHIGLTLSSHNFVATLRQRRAKDILND